MKNSEIGYTYASAMTLSFAKLTDKKTNICFYKKGFAKGDFFALGRMGIDFVCVRERRGTI